MSRRAEVAPPIHGRMLPASSSGGGGGGASAGAAASSAARATAATSTAATASRASSGASVGAAAGAGGRSTPPSVRAAGRGPWVLGAGGHVRSFRGVSDGAPFLGHIGPLSVVGSLEDESADACNFTFAPQQLFPTASPPALPPSAVPRPGTAPQPGPALAPLGAALLGLTAMVQAGQLNLSALPASVVNSSYLSELCPVAAHDGGLSADDIVGIVLAGVAGTTAAAVAVVLAIRGCCRLARAERR